MCILHKWEKWQQYDVPVPPKTLSAKWQLSGATDHMQKRVCKKCGRQQIERIGQTVH